MNMKAPAPPSFTLGSLLFLIYINDIANSSNKLSFRLFAADVVIFYTYIHTILIYMQAFQEQ